MRKLRAWFLRLRSLLNADRQDQELAEELESHLQMHIDDNLRAGMSHEEARRHALIDLGGVEQVKEEYRERRGIRWLDDLRQDLRYGVRILRKNRAFTAVAVMTLGLGIGANTAFFSVVNGVLWHSLPYEEPRQLVQVFETSPKAGGKTYAALPNFIEWKNLSHSFDGMAAFRSSDVKLTGGEFPEKIRSMSVSAQFFSTFRTQAAVEDFFQRANMKLPKAHL